MGLVRAKHVAGFSTAAFACSRRKAPFTKNSHAGLLWLPVAKPSRPIARCQACKLPLVAEHYWDIRCWR